jgi:uncharacterized protein (DUF1810 family)
MSADDPRDLSRFLVAQDELVHGDATTFDRAMREVRAGKKVSHWMWFVYPQLRALGRSPTARHFGIADLQEARAYWGHPVLGARLREAARATLASGKRESVAIFGDIDALKLRSCLTLFLAVAPADADLLASLDHFYDGVPDPVTIDALGT